MFSYEILTAEQAMQERYNLLKDGEYDAVILSSADKTSSKGSPMMDVQLQVFDDNGQAHDVRDFIVFTKAMMWKVIHFAESAGCLAGYEDGKLCSEMVVGKRVRVKISIEGGGEIPEDKLKGKPNGTKYYDKNKVDDYIKGASQGVASSASAFTDDDIAF